MAEKLHGLMARFDSPEKLLAAAEKARGQGYRRMDAYTPFPVDGLAEAVGFPHTRVPLIVLLGGLTGGLSGYVMQFFAQAIHYPFVVGGKPIHSWPMFIPVTFEMTILGASIAAVFGMLALNGFPMPYHPVFNVPDFDRASRDGFFLCIEARDKQFDAAKTKQFLQGLGAAGVFDVPALPPGHREDE